MLAKELSRSIKASRIVVHVLSTVFCEVMLAKEASCRIESSRIDVFGLLTAFCEVMLAKDASLRIEDSRCMDAFALRKATGNAAAVTPRDLEDSGRRLRPVTRWEKVTSAVAGRVSPVVRSTPDISEPVCGRSGASVLPTAVTASLEMAACVRGARGETAMKWATPGAGTLKTSATAGKGPGSASSAEEPF